MRYLTLEIDIHKKLSTFDLDMHLSAGAETIALLGESGCGKSMTLKCIAGVETPDYGKIVVNGTVFFDKASGKHARVNLSPQVRKTALLFQNYMLFPNLTVCQNVEAGIDLNLSKDERDKLVCEQLNKFSISKFRDAYPQQLSGGQQQRVALARMLAADPKILMLDEPLSALDSHLKGVLEQRLSFLFDDYDSTILYVSHDIDEALRLCSRIAVMDKGSVAEECLAQELVNRPTSLAGLKLSGCKNFSPAIKMDAHKIHLINWDIDLETKNEVSDDIKYFGVRAFHLRQVDNCGSNCYKMRVVHSTDSRFERSYVLEFVDVSKIRETGFEGVQSDYFENYLYWRLSILNNDRNSIPKLGDVIWIHIPDDDIYMID